MQVKRKAKNRASWRLKIVAFLVIVIFVSIARWVFGLYDTYSDSKTLFEEDRQKLEFMENRIAELERRNEYIQSDVGHEDLLIEQFPLKKPGERVLILPESPYEEAESGSAWSNWFGVE